MESGALMPLPEGFQLEQQAPQAPTIPPGFQLDDHEMQKQKAIADLKARPWGSGFPHLAYEVGGGITDLATKAGASPEVAAGAGYAGNVALQAVPALFSGRMAQEGLAEPMKDAGRALMQSAAKPTLAELRTGDAARGIETMLKEGYNPTEGSVAAMQARVDALGKEVSDAIANSSATVNKGAVGTRLMDAYNRFRSQVNPRADMDAIKQAWMEFRNHPDLAGKSDFPVQLAQQLKQGTYRALGDKPYGELQGAATEAQKQLARGLKEEISAAVPDVASKNNLQAELLNAKNIAERRALMSGNRNPLSLAPLAEGTAGKIGFLADKSDLLKAYLARLLYSGSNSIPLAAGAGAGAVVGAQSGSAPSQQEIMAQQLRGAR